MNDENDEKYMKKAKEWIEAWIESQQPLDVKFISSHLFSLLEKPQDDKPLGIMNISNSILGLLKQAHTTEELGVQQVSESIIELLRKSQDGPTGLTGQTESTGSTGSTESTGSTGSTESTESTGPSGHATLGKSGPYDLKITHTRELKDNASTTTTVSDEAFILEKNNLVPVKK